MAELRITASKAVSDDTLKQAGEVIEAGAALEALEQAGFKIETGIFPKRAPKTPRVPENAATPLLAAGNGADHGRDMLATD